MTIFFLAAKMQNSTMGKWENRKIGKQGKPEYAGLMLNTE